MITVTDRYTALGIKSPTPEASCKGHCEGTGYIPLNYSKKGPFVKCPDCNGTGHIINHDGTVA